MLPILLFLAHFALGTSGQEEQSEQRALEHYERANTLLQEHKYPEAEREIQEALRHFPHWPAGLNLAGVVAERQNRIQAAIEFYEQALNLKSDHLLARNNLAHAYLSSGDVQRALQEFEQILRTDPDHLGATLGKAKALFTAGRVRESLPVALRASALGPGQPEVLFLVAQLRFALGEQGVAFLAVKTLQELLWDQGAGLKLLAGLLFQHGYFTEAIPLLQRLAELGSREVEVFESLGYGYMLSSQIKKATATLQGTVESDPENSDSHYLLGICHEIQGRFEEASKHFGRVLELNPSHVEASHHQGITLYKQGRIDEASKFFQTVLERNPQRVEALYYRSLILFQKKDLEQAKQLLQAVLELEESYPAAHFKLAQIYTKLGQQAQAEKHLERFRQLRTEQKTYLRQLVFRIPRDADY